MKSAEHYDVKPDGGVPSKYLFAHIVKYRVIILKEVAHVARKKKNP